MADFTSRSIPGFIPEDMLLYTTPVQVTGHTVSNLTIAQSPLGQAIFGWTHAGVFYCAVNPDFEDVWRNDVVPDGDERVVYDNTGASETAFVGSLWVDRGDLYCAIKLYQTGVGVVFGSSVCFIADDPENPTSWTERGVIDSQRGDAGVVTVNQAGPPTILDSGRWVLPFPAWGPAASGAMDDRSGLSISDDRGITWTVLIQHRRSAGDGSTTGPISTCVGLDPVTGYLYWSHYSGPVLNQALAYVSTDDGSSWTILPNVIRQAWHYNIDNNVNTLNVTGPGTSEWTWYDDTSDLTDDSLWLVSTNTAIPSRQAAQFQTHVFLSYGDIAYVDTNRVARQPLPPCTLPTILFIPFKDRLLKMELDEEGMPVASSLSTCAEHDFENLKKIERWANDWMTRAGSADKCDLFIPFKDHLLHRELTAFDLPAIRSRYFDNMKKIERWAESITKGLCACSGPAKCRLFIPYKNAMAGLQADKEGVVDRFSLERAAYEDFENYKTIERWGNDNARGICATGGGNPFPPPPDPPDAAARIYAEVMEVSTQQASEARIYAEVMEVSTQQASEALLVGEVMEVAIVI